MNTALEYSTRVVQEGGRRCEKSTLNDLVHLTPLKIPLMNPPKHFLHDDSHSNKKNILHTSVVDPNLDPHGSAFILVR
jgi:hypothetical protein